MSKKPVKFNPVVWDSRGINPYCTLCDSDDCDHTKMALYLQQLEAADGHRFWCPSCASRDTQILPDGRLKCWRCQKVSAR